ncbi:MAG TPA: diacylglycerol kinase family protein [Flavobacterium sp.]|jgi:YegS/Rv2252/BmrU family lipid kinase
METQKKYVFVVNPISGDVDKTDISNLVTTFSSENNIDCIVYETTGNDDDAKIKSLFDAHRPERVIVAGGDGTIKMVGEALEKDDVIFGILPAGSANGLAVDLNLPTTVQENLAIAFFSPYKSIDMIDINGLKSLHLSDIGLNADLIKNYENSSTRGKLGYALQVVTTLSDMDEPFEATITCEEATVTCQARMIVIANSQKYGTGVTINPKGKMDDGFFEIVILKNFDLLIFGKIITGNMPLDTGDIEIITTKKATITTNVPVNFQIDGEFCGEETHLDIKILPGRMKVAVQE